MEARMFEWLMQRIVPMLCRRRVAATWLGRVPAPIDVLDEPQEERPLGCGWFDSSHDLRAGLVVREHADADAVSEQLGLAFWLELHLREWGGATPA